MPFVNIWIHAVWSTKQREPFLTKEIRQNVFDHVIQNAKSKGIFIDCVNGHVDHVHCLISLVSEQSVAKVIQLIKGESSFWINKNQLCRNKFEWQSEYFAVSVSQSTLESVRGYIHNQEAHHQKKSFNEEYKEFVEKYNFIDAG
jgi:putative transposase